MADLLTLAPGEGVPGRAFADPANTEHDLATLASMRRALRLRAREEEPLAGRWTDSGDQHWLVAPDPALLAAGTPVVAVGFFGDARHDVDHGPILRMEHELTDRAAEFPGLLAYHDVLFAESAQFGNLVVFAANDDMSHVRGDPLHVEAMERAHVHYRSVRLHRLRLPDGALGDAPAELVSTLLLDFGETPPWRAIRQSAGETS
jgi:hypothetical protein